MSQASIHEVNCAFMMFCTMKFRWCNTYISDIFWKDLEYADILLRARTQKALRTTFTHNTATKP